MAEGSETSGGGFGHDPPAGGTGPEGRFRRDEGDLLAERRARRAAGSGEQVLERRAEAAEATVRTLETHIASLQQRLREAEDERTRMSALIGAERASLASALGSRGGEPGGEQPSTGGMVEQELRRLKQSEYAEQRQRAEAEDRVAAVERESGTDVERLRRRLSDSESEAGMLAGRLEQLRRELAEAEQRLAAERAAMQLTEAELRERVAELERRSLAAERELESERAARERAERSLALVRAGHRKLEALVQELKDAGARLRAAAAAAPRAGADPSSAGGPRRAGEPTPVGERAPVVEPAPVGEPRAPAPAGEHAVAPVGEAAGPPERGRGEEAPQGAGVAVRAGASTHNGEMVDALAAAVERLRARVAEGTAAAPQPQPPQPRHKHSLSLIARVRLARKQRRRR